MADLLDGAWLFDSFGFSEALPLPTRIDTAKAPWSQRPFLEIQMRETQQDLGLRDADNPANAPLKTTVWGYGAAGNVTYPGPTIIAYEDVPLDVEWINRLPFGDHLLAVDKTIHLGSDGAAEQALAAGLIPTVAHLHGGHTESASDGIPEAWFTQVRGPNAPAPAFTGADYVKSIYTYDNDQPSSLLWYHDHAMGLTRLNVYAGLAGFYMLQDGQRTALQDGGVIPTLDHMIEAAVQDRAFTAAGQLYYPAFSGDQLPGTNETVADVVPATFYNTVDPNAPSVLPEFFGDHILVNGKTWPEHAVGDGKIGVELLNGSDSRFYVLEFDRADVGVTIIGGDVGLMPSAMEVIDGDGTREQDEYLLLAPGDRLELILDFSALADGETATLLNRGPTYEPFKGLTADGQLRGPEDEAPPTAAAPDDPVGNIMRFRVDASLPVSSATATDGTVLDGAYTDISGQVVDPPRKLGLFESTDDLGRLQPLLGTADSGSLHSSKMTPDGAFGPLLWEAPTTEKPKLDSTEQWDILNFTEDAHPIHLHLTRFQMVQRVAIDFEDGDGDGVPDDGDGQGIDYGYASAGDALGDPDVDIIVFDDRTPLTIRPEDQGWQDTVHVAPKEMVSIVAEFDRPGDYVWHCHILSHEDHEMMRRFTVEEDLLA